MYMKKFRFFLFYFFYLKYKCKLVDKTILNNNYINSLELLFVDINFPQEMP